MNFYKIFQPFHFPLFKKLYDNNAIYIQGDDNNYTFFMDKAVLNNKFIDSVKDVGSSIELFTSVQCIGQGPKIFEIKNRELLNFLETIDINLNVSDYSQPFNTMVVEFPEMKAVDCPQKNQLDPLCIFGKYPETHKPLFGIIYHNKDLKIIIVNIYYTSGQSMKLFITGKYDSTIEKALVRLGKGEANFDGCLETTDEEMLYTIRLARVCMNVCLFMEDLGIRNLGPVNPSHYHRLMKRIKNNNKVQSVREIKNELETMPFLFDFDKQLNLDPFLGIIPKNSNRTISPHYRRSHWRMQRYGKGLSQSKRIRIPATFVNFDLLTN